ncbi:NAD(P)H-hydrate dehydratase [Virgibacillus xinjiangensis]|uniref:Bifunctional NAD(P)H-hydrate repair enzyme n=1 Tax=Virgibacillus xinjiangensis TaxID=393090 RepID=A0ABV7CSR9_9BACI
MFIVTAKEMYDIDHYTMHEAGLDGKILMENAGRAISGRMEKFMDKSNKITVFAGAGNNGGDGFVIARTLYNRSYDVQVFQVVPDQKITGDAHYHKLLYLNYGGRVFSSDDHGHLVSRLDETDVIVDAMVGIGISGKLRAPISDIAERINQSDATVIAVDVPSGLPADEGISNFQSVQADYTYMVGAAKMTAFLESTSPYYGGWEKVDIGFPASSFPMCSSRELWGEEQYRETMPEREKYAHKGKHGKGLIIGGSSKMPGSIAMAAKASLKAGTGLLTVASSETVIRMIASHCVEAMYQPVPESDGYLTDDPDLSVSDYDAVAIGVGMGRSNRSAAAFRHAVQDTNGPLIVDADGFYHVKPLLDQLAQREHPTVLTPHPGEMAELMDVSIPEVLKNPFRLSAEFAEKYNVYVILKGRHTLITAPDGRQAVNDTGNPGLAKGGSGDVLTGIVHAMVMQEQGIFQALCNACFVHGAAADWMVENSRACHDLMATDVIEGISMVYRAIS